MIHPRQKRLKFEHKINIYLPPIKLARTKPAKHDLKIYILEGKLPIISKCFIIPTFFANLVFNVHIFFQNKQPQLHSFFHRNFRILWLLKMSSVTNPVCISFQRPQISSLFQSPKRVSTSHGLLKSRTFQLEAKDSSLVVSEKALKLRHRRFPVIAALAADANDNSEIEVTNGLVLRKLMFDYIVMKKRVYGSVCYSFFHRKDYFFKKNKSLTSLLHDDNMSDYKH